MFVHERPLRGVRRVRARTRATRRSLTIPPFCLAESDAAATVQINRLIWRLSAPSATRKFRHRPTNTARGGVTRRRGTEEDSKGGAAPRRVRVVRPGRVRPGRVDGSRDAARYRYRFFARSHGDGDAVPRGDRRRARGGERPGKRLRRGRRSPRARFSHRRHVQIHRDVFGRGRASNASATVSAARDAIPTVTLATPDPEVASTDTLRLVGSVERPPGAPDGELTLSVERSARRISLAANVSTGPSTRPRSQFAPGRYSRTPPTSSRSSPRERASPRWDPRAPDRYCRGSHAGRVPATPPGGTALETESARRRRRMGRRVRHQVHRRVRRARTARRGRGGGVIHRVVIHGNTRGSSPRERHARGRDERRQAFRARRDIGTRARENENRRDGSRPTDARRGRDGRRDERDGRGGARG